MAKPTPETPEKIWTTWADRAIARGPSEAARAGRFLEQADPLHPNLKGLPGEIRAALIQRLTAAGKGR